MLLAALPLFFGCASLGSLFDGDAIRWSGVVTLEETFRLERGQKLIIEPGTEVRFAFKDEDNDGWGEISIVLEGDLQARGTPKKPIIFTTADGMVSPGRWGEIRVDFGKISASYVVIEGSTRGLHLHFAAGKIEDSILRFNVDGTRIGESHIEFNRCLFANNTGKGYNARTSQNVVKNSWFRDNRRGIFLFEGDKGSRITRNRFSGNDTPFRLGDFYVGTVSTTGNQWEKEPLDFRAETNTDADLKRNPAAGTVKVGPADWPMLTKVWQTEMEGFVDADIMADEFGVYAADWSGNVKRLGFLAGKVIAQTKLGDTVDARPSLTRISGKNYLAVQSWDRKLALLDGETLEVLDTFTEVESNADDHRQSAPVFRGKTLFVATWAGNVHGFNVEDGKLSKVWTYEGGAPHRADLTISGDGKIIAPSSGGELALLDPATGEKTFSWTGEAPLLSGVVEREGRYYAGDKNGQLNVIDPTTGSLSAAIGLCGPSWYAQPATLKDAVYVADDGGCLTRVTLDTAKWTRKLDGGIRSAPALINGYLAVATLGGSLYIIDPKGGRVLDRIKLDEPIHTTPAVLGGRLFIGGRDGMVRAFDLVEHKRPE